MAQGHMACGRRSEMEADRDVSFMSTCVFGLYCQGLGHTNFHYVCNLCVYISLVVTLQRQHFQFFDAGLSFNFMYLKNRDFFYEVF